MQSKLLVALFAALALTACQKSEEAAAPATAGEAVADTPAAAAGAEETQGMTDKTRDPNDIGKE